MDESSTLSAFLSTLPVAFRGISSRNLISSGIHQTAIFPARCALIYFAVTFVPWDRWMIRIGRSPHL